HDLVTRYAPDFLGVGLEEYVVQALSKPVGDPLFECLFRFLGKHLGAQVAEKDQCAVPDAETQQSIGRAQWVIKEFLVVVDARETTTSEKLSFSENFAPHRVNGFDLREETMAADVEVIAFVIYCPRDTADDAIFLEYQGANAGLAKLV